MTDTKSIPSFMNRLRKAYRALKGQDCVIYPSSAVTVLRVEKMLIEDTISNVNFDDIIEQEAGRMITEMGVKLIQGNHLKMWQKKLVKGPRAGTSHLFLELTVLDQNSTTSKNVTND